MVKNRVLSNTNKDLSIQAEAMIPTPWGNFNMVAFAESKEEWMPHLAMVHENFEEGNAVLVRVHSECITGDLFGSKRCDCGQQLAKAMEMAAENGGIVLYLRQEGRGIGIINKLKAYQLQDTGMNTIDANLHLGLDADSRQYDIAIQMLQTLGVDSIKLMTNNPEKVGAFDFSAVDVIERVPIEIDPVEENYGYLKTKKDDMGHFLNML
ncbi:MAG: GTP cyclohydrolase II [Saprospiraceae bacterium]|nr:GTP cyclohydrolase II [Saprospiraceae bacterium]